MLRELPAHRDLLWLLVVRDIRVRYARAALGAAWAVFPPVMMAVVFSVLNFERLVDDGSPYAGIAYPAFALVGLVPWAHFSTSLTQATPSLVLAGQILKKTRFPFEAVPLARMLAALLDFAVGSVVLAAVLAWNRDDISVGLAVLSVPFVFAAQLVFTSGLALLLSALNMLYRDVNYLVQVGIVLAMFATSVVYPIPAIEGAAARVLALNPMSAYIDAYRAALLLGHWPTWSALLPGIVGACVSLAIGVAVFSRCAPRFPEEV